MKDAVVDVIVACTRFVGDAGRAIFEQRMPDPDIERIEIAERHACRGVANESGPDDAGLGKAEILEPSTNPEFNVGKDVVGVLVAGVEVRSRVVKRLIDSDACGA